MSEHSLAELATGIALSTAEQLTWWRTAAQEMEKARNAEFAANAELRAAIADQSHLIAERDVTIAKLTTDQEKAPAARRY